MLARVPYTKFTFRFPDPPSEAQFILAKEQPEQFRLLNQLRVKETFRQWFKERWVFFLGAAGVVFAVTIFISAITFAPGDGDGLTHMIGLMVMCGFLSSFLTFISWSIYTIRRNNYVERVIDLARTCDSFELFCKNYTTVPEDEFAIQKKTTSVLKTIDSLRTAGLYSESSKQQTTAEKDASGVQKTTFSILKKVYSLRSAGLYNDSESKA